MSFWTDIRDGIRNVTNFVTGTISKPFEFTGQRLGDVLGPSFSKFGKEFGTDFGKNLKTDFNLTIEAAFKIDVDIKFPDLVTASELIRDGLTKFDITGGILRALRSDLEQFEVSRKQLQELYEIIKYGHSHRPRDTYFFDVQIINLTTKRKLTNNDSENFYFAEKPCECRVTILINSQSILEKNEYRINESDNTIPSPVRIEQRILATNLNMQGTNNILFQVSPTNSQSLIENCRVRISFKRKTQQTEYTLLEWIFDGSSESSPSSYQVVINDPEWSPQRELTKKGQALLSNIEDLLNSLKFPFPYNPTDSSTPFSLLQNTMLAAYHIRINAVEKVLSTFNNINDDDPNTLDLRSPLTATLKCLSGSVRVTIRVSAETNYFVPLGGIILNKGDMTSIQLPLRAGLNIPSDNISEHEISFSLELAPDCNDCNCTASIYSGFQFSSQILNARTIQLNRLNNNFNFKTKIKLSDGLN